MVALWAPRPIDVPLYFSEDYVCAFYDGHQIRLIPDSVVALQTRTVHRWMYFPIDVKQRVKKILSKGLELARSAFPVFEEKKWPDIWSPSYTADIFKIGNDRTAPKWFNKDYASTTTVGDGPEFHVVQTDFVLHSVFIRRRVLKLWIARTPGAFDYGSDFDAKQQHIPLTQGRTCVTANRIELNTIFGDDTILTPTTVISKAFLSTDDANVTPLVWMQESNKVCWVKIESKTRIVSVASGHSVRAGQVFGIHLDHLQRALLKSSHIRITGSTNVVRHAFPRSTEFRIFLLAQLIEVA